jgi:hypothetical protein
MCAYNNARTTIRELYDSGHGVCVSEVELLILLYIGINICILSLCPWTTCSAFIKIIYHEFLNFRESLSRFCAATLRLLCVVSKRRYLIKWSNGTS